MDRKWKEELAAYKGEARQERIEMNKRWGEIANKMGTLVEDMVAPNIKGTGKRIIPIFASLYLSDDVIDYLTENKIYAMAIKEDTMNLLNFDEI